MVINNAGIQYNYSFKEKVDFESIDREVEINLNAVIKLSAAFIPILMENKESAIINISSGTALNPKKSAPVYCATKAGVHMFSKALRYQLEDSHIKVFEVLPLFVDTQMGKHLDGNELSVGQLVDEFIRGLGRNNYEMNIGKVKLYKMMHRIYPRFTDRILKYY
jgi:short-subunit dehydrogenase involved in D-alanine esterification of teichoic acids